MTQIFQDQAERDSCWHDKKPFVRPGGAPEVEVQEDAGDRVEERAEIPVEEGPGPEGIVEEGVMEAAREEPEPPADDSPKDTPSRPRRKRGGHRLLFEDDGDAGINEMILMIKLNSTLKIFNFS